MTTTDPVELLERRVAYLEHRLGLHRFLLGVLAAGVALGFYWVRPRQPRALHFAGEDGRSVHISGNGVAIENGGNEYVLLHSNAVIVRGGAAEIRLQAFTGSESGIAQSDITIQHGDLRLLTIDASDVGTEVTVGAGSHSRGTGPDEEWIRTTLRLGRDGIRRTIKDASGERTL